MSFWRKYIFSTDHKIIGIQFLFVSLFFLLVGGVLAMQIRWQVGFPGKPLPGGVPFVLEVPNLPGLPQRPLLGDEHAAVRGPVVA